MPLASHTTLEVGGPARYLARCDGPGEARRALAWAEQEGLETFVLGGGSNLLVSDGGFDGLVVQLTDQRLKLRRQGEHVLLTAGAGLSWEGLVRHAVAERLAGVEALSGIPGLVGAAPIQNIGAYGQELSETLEAVDVLELATGETTRLSPTECELGYRTSAFKTRWRGRFAVTGITLRLRPGGAGTVRYKDLERHFGLAGQGSSPSPGQVRQAVLEIRRSKSMVLDPADPNRRSAGSFFVNPVLPEDDLPGVRNRVAGLRGEEAAEAMPRFPDDAGGIKLSAAWLIEAAGFHRGYCLGAAGLSTRHVLALINRGGASAEELVALARRIRRRVREAFGIPLRPEPYFLGFDQPVEELLS